MSNFSWLTIFFLLQKEALSDVWPVQGLLKETNGKNWIFYFKKREK